MTFISFEMCFLDPDEVWNVSKKYWWPLENKLYTSCNFRHYHDDNLTTFLTKIQLSYQLFYNSLKCNAISSKEKHLERYNLGEFDIGHIVWKSPKMSHLNFWTLAFFANFCPIKTDLSGNTVWPQASGFQKLAKLDNFCHC